MNLPVGRQKPPSVAVMEKDLIQRTLEYFDYQITLSAKSLGFSKETLYRRLREYGIKDQTLTHTKRGRRKKNAQPSFGIGGQHRPRDGGLLEQGRFPVSNQLHGERIQENVPGEIHGGLGRKMVLDNE